jgi:hypothetical protein
MQSTDSTTVSDEPRSIDGIDRSEVGVDARDVENVFEPFYTTKSGGRASGYRSVAPRTRTQRREVPVQPFGDTGPLSPVPHCE